MRGEKWEVGGGARAIKVGCCGFTRGMAHYFQEFKLVEVQQTFYQPPHPSTARRWRALAPPDFEFTLKAWQLITHPVSSPTYRQARLTISPEMGLSYGNFRPTPEVWEAWEKTREIAQVLRARLVVFQCPPSFRDIDENRDNMRHFFHRVRSEGFTLVWEPRGGWPQDTVLGLCQELGLVHGADPFQEAAVYGQPRYYRLHGGPGYRHRFTPQELLELRGRLAGVEAYVLFNNLSRYEDALSFRRLVEKG